jgi:tripartite-type tricarboxylate transporter receptor subunit TctC
MRVVSTFAAILLSSLLSAPSVAQDFPGRRPIEMTVMFGAGSAADVTARRLADGMAKELDATIPVINRTGAGGALGYNSVSRQPADG